MDVGAESGRGEWWSAASPCSATRWKTTSTARCCSSAIRSGPTTRPTLTYYLWRGRPGLDVGACTDALFGNVTVDAL